MKKTKKKEVIIEGDVECLRYDRGEDGHIWATITLEHETIVHVPVNILDTAVEGVKTFLENEKQVIANVR